MTEKRNITKEDIFLKTRILAEGVRLDVKGPALWQPTMDGFATNPHIVFDGCEITAVVRPNPHSRLDMVIDGNDITISEMGEVLGTAKLQAVPAWGDKLTSYGVPVKSAIAYDTAFVATLLIGNRCYAQDSGQTCRFCGIGYDFAQSGPLQSAEQTLAFAEYQMEPLVIALENGWRGVLLLVGGAAPPDRRGQWTTDILEATMTRLHERVSADILSELLIAPDIYPPDDLGELYKWKSFGINACEFDHEVMNPAYFRAICPAKGEKQRWHEAQEAAAEVFGRGRGSNGLVVQGIEPMAELLEGIEERMSKGVYVQPFTFESYPNAPMEGMRAPSAEWFMEANEKIVDIYFKYGDTFDVPLTEDDRYGYTRRGQSYNPAPSDDEMTRRLQEMGKLPPGLPKQDGIELA